MMTPVEADGFTDAAAAYVHIPFCSAVCPYCDFAVVAGKDHLAVRYVDAVCTEVARADSWRPLDAVYFGGGTPSHVAPELLERILGALAAKHGLAADAELSLEANPEDFALDRAIALREIGFNRISFGAQSFDDAVLVSLGRRHTASQVETSVRTARDAGFGNVSIDLIFGTPGETDESWAGTLGRAIAAEPDHVSCYALTVEPGTPLGRSVRDGAESPDPDVQADRYELADRKLTTAGYDRYEVSNWSLPGRECRYNLTVWAQGEYEAYGNGAHGYRRGLRYRNHRRLDAYIERVESGRSPRAGQDVITGWDAEIDRLFVGLRRTVGVAAGAGTETLLTSDEGESLLGTGVLTEQDDRLVVSRPLLIDAVHRSVVALERPIVKLVSDA
jgi:putative oxygen-independent coproporphyrinogen III oxidase